jgi:hypothetical protein
MTLTVVVFLECLLTETCRPTQTHTVHYTIIIEFVVSYRALTLDNTCPVYFRPSSGSSEGPTNCTWQKWHFYNVMLNVIL